MEQNLLSVEPLHSRDTANFVTRNRAVQQKPHRPQAQNRRQTGKCRNCGYTWPHTKSPCPAQGKQCNTCGKNNHFSKVCRAKQFPPKQRPSQGKNIRQISHASAPPQSESEDEYLFTLTTKKNKSPAVEVKINNCPVQMILDTGASTNIVDQATYNKLAAKGKIRLQKSDASLFAYNMDTPLKTLGKFTATFESKHKVTVDDIHVISGNAGCLLSYKTASDLMLITLHINTVDNCPLNSEYIAARYPQIFDGIGKLKDFEVKLHIDETVPPVAQNARRIPFHMRQKVAAALQELEAQDIIEPVEGPTPYVSPIVVIPKKDGKVRICVDMRMPNRAIQRERHQSPTVDDLIHALNGAQLFSKLDLRSGYHQLTLAPDSRYVTTFATHKGLRRYKRLNFGTNSAGELFQRVISDQIRDIPGAINISDDVIIYGKTPEEHNKALKAVIEKFIKVGLTLNREKCLFAQKSLTFFGFVFSDKGVSADPEKVKSIHNAPAPQSASEVRSFLGMATYCAKFIPRFSDLTHSLRELTKKNTPFRWSEKQQQDFDALKKALTSHTVVAYFDPHKETEVITDASPVGLSAILSQLSPTKQRRVVAYVSRALTPTERRYSQTEREALGIVWAVERLHTYLYGGSFKLYTDCKPIEMILNNPKSNPPARIARWNLRLQEYNFDVIHTKGQDNPSDFLSRHPIQDTTMHNNNAEDYVNFLSQQSVPKAMTLSEIATATCNDATLQRVISNIRDTNWQDIYDKTRTLPENINRAELLQFHKIRQELTVTDSNIVLRNTRIVLPNSLRTQAINIAHEGHQGLVKTKKLLRTKIWFPGIDERTENIIKHCLACQATGPAARPEPLKMTKLPPAPWHTVNIDFLGPLPTGEYLLVVIDAYSRFPEVEIVTSTSAKSTIPKLEGIFARHGIPEILISDNGPPFSSSEIQEFMRETGPVHRRITPLWPQANAQAETFMKPLTKAIRSAVIDKRNWRKELNRFLLSYRATPHSTTQFSPAQLLFNRSINTKLPQLTTENTSETHQHLVHRDFIEKGKMKENTDRAQRAKASGIDIGDTVLVKQPKQNKLSTNFNPDPYIVIERKGTMLTAYNEGKDHTITRNISHFKRFPIQKETEIDSDIDDEDIMDMPNRPNIQAEVLIPRYPVRERRSARRYGQNIYET